MTVEMPEAWGELEALEAQLGRSPTLRHSFRPASLRPSGQDLAEAEALHDTLLEGSHATTAGDTIALPSKRGSGEETVAAAEGEGAPASPVQLRVIGALGEGGMGIVLRAAQPSLQREVAVKRLKDRSPGAAALFRAEARITGSLDHSNIIPVHFLEEGRSGEPALAMKLVEGRSWQELLRARGEDLELREQLRILIEVCQAVSFAHSRGIIHRDLKPANVMVGAFGQVYVMDWGLAAALDEATARRFGVPWVERVSEPCGTPGYMAPELAAGAGPQQSKLTDVYLLGACLHEVLTRQVRHRGANIIAALNSAVASEPYPYEPHIPNELACIATRAMAAEPAERIASVEDLRLALEAALEHEQAVRLTAKAVAILDEVEGGRGAETGAAVVEARSEQLAEARFALRHAREIWPESVDVAVAVQRLRRELLREALERQDATEARRLLEAIEAPDEALRAEVEALERRLSEEAAELEALRAASRQLDWGEVSQPLGTLFLCAALLVAAASFLSGWLWRSSEEPPQAITVGLWAVVCVILGMLAVRILMRPGMQATLLTERMMGLWGSVCLACFVGGTAFGLALDNHAPAVAMSAMLVAVGLAGTAFQSRRWLLIPAAAWLINGPLMLLFERYCMDLFGCLWLISCGAIGFALRRGVDVFAREREPTPSPGAAAGMKEQG